MTEAGMLNAHQEEIMEQVLPSTSSYPAHLTQLKRGIRTLAASQAETMQAFTALHRAATLSCSRLALVRPPAASFGLCAQMSLMPPREVLGVGCVAVCILDTTSL